VTRRQLTSPLRVGPWWVGMLGIPPLLPLMLVAPFCEAFSAFGRSLKEQVADLRTVVAIVWADRKRPLKTCLSESEKPGWSGPGELIP